MIPAVREIAKDLELPGPFEADPAGGQSLQDSSANTGIQAENSQDAT